MSARLEESAYHTHREHFWKLAGWRRASITAWQIYGTITNGEAADPFEKARVFSEGGSSAGMNCFSISSHVVLFH